MHRTHSGLRSVAAFLFAALLALPALSQDAPAKEPNMDSHVKVGQLMPNVDVKEIDGATFDLHKLRGKIILVNFWATWCGPCMLEMPHLQADVWNRYKSNPDFAMVAIAREQDQQTITGFQHSHPTITFPLAADPQRSTYALFADAGIPRSYLVGRDGRVLYETLGDSPSDLAKLEHALQSALSR